MNGLTGIWKLLSEGKIYDCLNELRIEIQDFSEHHMEVLQLLSRYNNLRDNESKGIVKYEEARIERNQIIDHTTKLLFELGEDKKLLKFLENKNKKLLVGLDFGDSETVVSTINVSEIDQIEYKNLTIRNFNLLSALLQKDKFTYEIGEDTIFTCKNPDDIILNFKMAPMVPKPMHQLNGEERRKILEKSQRWDFCKSKIEIFLKTLLFQEKFTDNELNQFKNSVLYVGHPSSWEKLEVQSYLDFLESFFSSIFGSIRVVSESRSALIAAKDSKDISKEDLKKEILVIDIGSSTIDSTLISNGEVTEIISGKEFGCKLIDFSIKDWLLSKAGKKFADNYCNESTNNGRKNIYFITYLSKKFKEHIYSGIQNYNKDFENEELNYIYHSLKGFFPDLSEDIIRSMLINEGTNEEYLNKTWEKGFENILKEVKSKCQTDISIILLTGGGALMPFTKAICSKVFHLPNEQIHFGKNPLMSVSEGLVRYGVWIIKVKNFQREIKNLCEKELRMFLKGNILPFYNNIMYKLFPIGYDKFAKPRIKKYIDGKIDIEELGSSITKYASQEVAEWLNKDPEGIELKSEILDGLIDLINQWINQNLKPVFDKYDITDVEIRLNLLMPPNLFEHNVLEMISQITTTLTKPVLKKMGPNWRKRFFSWLVEGDFSEIISKSYRGGAQFGVDIGKQIDSIFEKVIGREKMEESHFKTYPFFETIFEAIYSEIYREITKTIKEEYEILIT